MAYGALTSVFSMASEKLGSIVSLGGTSSGASGSSSNLQGPSGLAASMAPSTTSTSAPTAKYSFGERNPQAQEELDRFLQQEHYLETLQESFKSLSIELLTLIDCAEESKKNYSALSENFAAFATLKGNASNIDQLSTIAKDIS